MLLQAILYLVLIIWGGSLAIGLLMWAFMRYENARKAKTPSLLSKARADHDLPMAE